MKSYRNIHTILRKETIGRRFTLVGLAILFIGMIASFVPNWYPPGAVAPNAVAAFLQKYWALASVIALPAGFLCASIGSYFINRFARRRWPENRGVARPDEILERSMKGFDDKYAYFAFSLPGSYIVAGPCGVLIFAVRSDRGKVVVKGDRWREPFSLLRFLTVFAREGVGNPTRELADQVAQMQDLLRKAPSSSNGDSSDGGGAKSLAEVPIEGAAVFLNSETKLELDGPTVTVLRADQVKEFLRRKAKEARLSSSTTRALTEFLRTNSTYQIEETV